MDGSGKQLPIWVSCYQLRISLAADYTVCMPEDMPSVKIFFWTYLGLNTPLILVEILGAAAMTTFTQKATWEDAYNNSSVGGLLGAGLSGPMGGFGSFLLVIMALSIISNNIPNMYSLALTFQVSRTKKRRGHWLTFWYNRIFTLTPKLSPVFSSVSHIARCLQ